jgi:hypothetical protein
MEGPSEKEKLAVFERLTAYLLYERQEETEMRAAFATLVQERHSQFHDEEGRITQFTECGNLICVNALQMLQSARKPRVELNELSVELIRNYNVKVQQDPIGRRCTAYLEETGGSVLKPLEEGRILKVE